MYLERTTDRIRNSVSPPDLFLFFPLLHNPLVYSPKKEGTRILMGHMLRMQTYRLTKTIPLRRRGSLPQLNRRLSNLTIEVAVHFQRNSSSVSTFALVSRAHIIIFHEKSTKLRRKTNGFSSHWHGGGWVLVQKKNKKNGQELMLPGDSLFSVQCSSAPTAYSSPSRTGGGFL